MPRNMMGTRHSLWHVSLCLLALSSSNEAFSTVPTTLSRTTPSLHTLYSTVEEAQVAVDDVSFISAADSEGDSLMTTKSEHVHLPPPAELSLNDINQQSRSFDKNTIINTSILIFAIALVIERCLSVDVGITRGWSPTEIAERIPLDDWRAYNNILSMAPLQTKAITSATVYFIGDVISQRQEGNDIGALDRGRTVRSLLAGLIGHGPMSHVWYHVSEDFFENILHLHAWWDFIPKIVVDQTVFGPIWNNTYILLLGLMQLQRPQKIYDDMKRTTIPLIISGLKLWPFVHCITYGLIPVENRLLWVDAVEIVWVSILAKEASGNKLDEEDVSSYDSELMIEREKENT